MPRTKISEFSATAASNTDIDSINIAEGCAPSGINDAIRELMAQLKDFQTGAVGDSFNGPVGASTASTGAFTTLSASGNVTLSGGTANGVAYLNGSKVVTSGSALTFDGANIIVNATTPAYFTGTSNLAQVSINRSPSTGAIFNASQSAAYLNIDGASGGSSFQFVVASAANTQPSEQMRLTSTGLGIGTSSPSYKLQVNGSSTGDLVQFTDGTYQSIRFGTSTTGFYYNNPNGGYQAWNISGSEKMRLDSSGNLGLGVTPSAWDSTYRVYETQGNAFFAGYSGQLQIGQNAYYNGGWLYKTTAAVSKYYQVSGTHVWQTAPSGTAGNAITFTQAMTLDASGNLGVGTTSPDSIITFAGNITSKGSDSYGIGTNGGNNHFNVFATGASGAVRFWTGGSSATSVGGGGTERARIDSSGSLLVNTTTSTPASITSHKLVVERTASVFGAAFGYATDSTARTQVTFYNSNGAVGTISTSGSVTSYNVTSDQRLKENIQDADSASSLIDSLKVRKFDWKSDNTHQRYGFIAQELVTVAPEAVHQPTDADEMMAVDYSKLVPMLVKEIQSLRKRLADAGIA